LKKLLFLIFVLSCVPLSGADAVDDRETGKPDIKSAEHADSKDEATGPRFTVMPVPQSDPTTGTGLGLIGAYFYEVEGAEEPWVTGVGGLYTNTKSYAFGAAQKANFARDTYRLTAGAGYGLFNLDFYGIGSSAGDIGYALPIEQAGTGIFVKGLARVADNFYVGLAYQFMHIRTRLRLSGFAGLPNLPDVELDSVVSSPGIALEYDTRDSEYYPTTGVLADFDSFFASEALGSDSNFETYRLTGNGYFSLNESSVIALRGTLCDSSDETPFFKLCRFGSRNDLRGYESGRYRDFSMYAVQGEYRWRFAERWGLAAFGGVGGVAPKISSLPESDLLPSVGAGLRFLAVPVYGVDASIDYAVGKDGESGFYFYIGQAF